MKNYCLFAINCLTAVVFLSCNGNGTQNSGNEYHNNVVHEENGYKVNCDKRIINSEEILLCPFFDEDNNWGYIDNTGRVVIQPQFDEACDFSEGLAAVVVNGKTGYIDNTGDFVIKPQFDELLSLFSEGLSPVKVGNKYGYINKDGKMVINPVFDFANCFSEGLASVIIDEKVGYIDHEGNIIIQPQFDWGGYKGFYTIMSRSPFSAITKIHDFSHGFALVIQDDQEFFINRKGDKMLGFDYEFYGCFSEELAIVQIEGKSGYIDMNGKIVIQPQFDGAGCFSDGLAPVFYFDDTNESVRCGFIDKTGHFVINPVYEGFTWGFFNGLAVLINLDEDTISYLDKEGNVVHQGNR